MSDLSGSERLKLERLLSMGGGYVLNFSDRTFRDFFEEHGVKIDAQRYFEQGTSKAKRMRTHWKLDANYVVGRVIVGLIDFATNAGLFVDTDPVLIKDCRDITQRLLSVQTVTDLDALAASGDGRNFEILAEHVREAINKN